MFTNSDKEYLDFIINESKQIDWRKDIEERIIIGSLINKC